MQAGKQNIFGGVCQVESKQETVDLVWTIS
jgi:hypothetical protein